MCKTRFDSQTKESQKMRLFSVFCFRTHTYNHNLRWKTHPKRGEGVHAYGQSDRKMSVFLRLPFARKCEVTTSFEQQNQKPHKEDLRTVPFTIPFIRSPSSKHCAKEWVARAEWGLMTVMGLEAQISLHLTHSIRVSLCIQWASWAWNGIRRSVRFSLHMRPTEQTTTNDKRKTTKNDK